LRFDTTSGARDSGTATDVNSSSLMAAQAGFNTAVFKPIRCIRHAALAEHQSILTGAF